MKEQFEEYRFTQAVKTRIELANSVLAEYAQAGYRLTIRQLYYQLVARGYIENNQRSYKRIVSTLTKARMAGLVDWDAIEDRTRHTMRPSEWNNHIEIMEAVASQFRLPRWNGQKHHVEIMIEKEALAGVFSPLVRKYHVNITANRGYSSASEMYRHAQRIRRLQKWYKKEVHILYFGDHDPSGMDMDRDIAERLLLLSWGTPFTFERLALTMGQIEEYDPPPNPAKLSDSRVMGYIDEFGYDSWELDALEPQTLSKLVEDAVLQYRDEDRYNEVLDVETDMKERVKEYAQQEKESWDFDWADVWELGPVDDDE